MIVLLDVCLLGTGGMQPLPNRYLTCFYIRYGGENILIDCGEGTQTAIQELGWGYKDINYLLLTHVHGDHVFGLPGLLSCMTNAGKTNPLVIIGPSGTKSIVTGLSILNRNPGFNVMVHELDFNSHTMELGPYKIACLPVPHSIKCFAYTVSLSRLPQFLPEKAMQNKVPQRLWKKLQRGETHTVDGITYTPNMVIEEGRKGLKFAYMTDCRPLDAAISFVADADLLVSEAMYFDEAMLPQVKKHKHMLATESATIAKKANVKELWLTHYSPSIQVGQQDVKQSRQIFNATYLGKDLKSKTFKFED